MSTTAWERLRNQSFTAQQSRAVDRLAIEKYGMHSLVLMENAAIGCVQWLTRKFSAPQETTILCGRGNNGGDGLAIARHLTVLGWPCTVILFGPIARLSPDAQANYHILTTAAGLDVQVSDETLHTGQLQQLQQSSLVIDAMLGTGARGAPRAPLDQWIEAANQCRAFRVAIDVPTGVDGDGEIMPACFFQADATLTFVTKKPAMDCSATSHCFGEIQVLPIGIPTQMMEELTAG